MEDRTFYARVDAPVGGGGKRDTLGGESGGEGFGSDDPGERSPGGGEGGDKDTGEGDEDLAGDGLSLVGSSNDTDDDLSDEHDRSAVEEDLSSTEPVDDVHTGPGANEVDNREDDLGDVGVVESGGLEELDSVREEEVDTYIRKRGGGKGSASSEI